ncbi:hypothetical protein GW7_12065 [Heterocephalus glaber]|uniref:Uncharacterized protein n=1 Tax=Heterocephalus glaber TaxID=10181 RepID=G5C085_HETGA|nr:hypothetical protein GW7_12065 [Heterocephalus glaber]
MCPGSSCPVGGNRSAGSQVTSIMGLQSSLWSIWYPLALLPQCVQEMPGEHTVTSAVQPECRSHASAEEPSLVCSTDPRFASVLTEMEQKEVTRQRP